MKTRRTWRPLLALFAAALVAAVGLAPKTAWAADGAVAKIGNQEFNTVQEAIDSVKSGESATIVLLGDVSESSMSFKTANVNITVDLEGNTFSANSDEAVSINADSVTLVIQNGTITNFHVGNYSDGLYAYEKSNNLNLTLLEVNMKSRTQCLAVQGLTSNSNVSIVNSTIASTEEIGIYYPPKSGVLTIEGSTVEGTTGIVLKGSKLVVSAGSTIRGTGENKAPDSYYTGTVGGAGFNDTGDALYIESGYNDRDIVVDVSGGNFVSTNAYAVRFFQKEGEETSSKREVAITGGTFSSDVSEFLPENVEQNEDGTIVERPAVATIGENKYYSLEAALADAKANDTITLQQDVELDAHLAIKTSGVTLNLNEKTISASDSFADAAGVDAQLLGIEGADNVTIENGTLKAGKTNTHTLNVWNAGGITLRNLTLNNAATKGGAPLIVGASDATLKGTVEFVVGPKSWYAANVDSRYLGANNTDPKSGSLKTAEETVLVFNGTGDSLANGICIENTAADGKTTSTVTFGKNSAIVSPDVESFKPVYLHENNETPADDAVIDPGNAGLAINDEGEVIQLPFVTFVVDGHAIKMLNADASGKIDFAPVYEAIDKNIPDGMVFDGWYTDEDFTKTFDPNKPITEDTTLYGRFVPTPVETVTITFMYGDKVYAEAEAPLNGSIPTDKIPADPTWEGHTFAGWYAKVNEDGSVVEDSKVDLATAKFGSDATLYAGFVANDEGGATTTPDSGEKTDGKKTETLAQTSDPTTFLPAIFAGVAGLTTVAGAAVLRKRQR